MGKFKNFLLFLKCIKNIDSRIKNSFKKIKLEISNLRKGESDQDKKIARLEGMMLVLIKQAGANQMQESAKVKNRPVQEKEISLPMKFKKGYKKKQIIEEMQNLNNQGYAVTEIEQAIVDKFGISRRTFYNYKKRLVVKVNLQ